ncbi:MAG: NitT/TauT family transport system permease protein [Clostridia bacterium]|nr:binding-protein-dependent transport system inner rane component [Clostridiales bacterium]MDK2985385.1 NitT/TauT family transport system permease protein [Clostridia bacterium]
MQLLMTGFKKMYYLLAIILLVLIWWSLSALLNTNALPSPLHAFKSFLASLQGGLLTHIGVSLFRVLISLLLAMLIGVPAGLFLGKNPQVDKHIAPVIYLTYPIPKVVFMPILLILLGIGNLSKIVLITLIVFYQILVTTRDAAKNLKKEYILSVKSLGARSGELYRHVFLPGCLPAILTSLRLGLGTALAVLFLAETYATQRGIGYFIMDALSRMAYEEMFAGIIAMGAMGYLLYLALDGAEKILCSWINL